MAGSRGAGNWLPAIAALCPTFPYSNCPTNPTVGNRRGTLYVVRLQLDRLSASRAQVFAALRAENIGVNVHYIPIPWMTHYARLGFQRGQWPVAEGEYERLLSLPLFPAMTDQDHSDVVTALHKVWHAYGR